MVDPESQVSLDTLMLESLDWLKINNICSLSLIFKEDLSLNALLETLTALL